jgi:DNA-binding NtrC family response regulator
MSDPKTASGRPGSELTALFQRFLREGEGRGRGVGLRPWLELAETWRIREALRETRGNRSAAARLLGIGRRTLYAKMHKLGLQPGP